MTARPSWVRKVWTALLGGAGLVLAVLAYFYFQVTADVDPAGFQQSNIVDAKEVPRKLKIYQEALRGGRRGFIRLTEAEMNSYVREQILSGTHELSANRSEGEPRLVACRVKLSPEEIAWYCWMEKRWLGKNLRLVWERSVEPTRGGSRWLFPVRSMRVGRMEIAPRFWPYVERELGGVDRWFASQPDWLNQVAGFEVKTNELTAVELRLFTYSLPERHVRAKP